MTADDPDALDPGAPDPGVAVVGERPSVGRRRAAIAGHARDEPTARRALDSCEASVRATALGALERMGALDATALTAALADADPGVRRRAATLAAAHRDVELLSAVGDDDALVVEAAAWALGERTDPDDAELAALVRLAQDHGADPLARESAVAALGAIGDARGLDAVLAATGDKPAIRRRAVIALAAFCEPGARFDEVLAAITAALADRDWQVRHAAEDLLAAIGGPDDEHESVEAVDAERADHEDGQSARSE